MWNVFNGTILNAITVTLGSILGLTVAKSLPERYRVIILQCLGLMTITLAIDAGVLGADTIGKFKTGVDHPETYGARLGMVVISSLLVGAVIGTALRLHERIEGAGAWIHRRFSPGGEGGRFAEAFLTASVIFCVGPLTLMGCLENGAHANPGYLYIKSVLDGFCSLALASSLGAGVLASVLTIVFFQGGLSAIAYLTLNPASHSGLPPIHPLSVELMSAVGGIILLATAFLILDLKRLAVANMLPGIFLPPIAVWLAQLLAPGWLLPKG